MSNNKIVTPILLKDNETIYNMMNIILMQDGSIYFSFPSKRNNQIISKSIKKYSKKKLKFTKRKIKKIKNGLVEPKISFHPKSMIVHVNSNKKRRKNDNYKLYNYIESNNSFGCYLLQVILPINTNIFDVYTKTKHKDYIVLEKDKFNKNEAINLEFIVHTNNISPDFSNLPFSINRRPKQAFNFTGCNTDYTYTVFVSTLPSNLKNDFITVSINSQTKNCIYNISNKIV